VRPTVESPTSQREFLKRLLRRAIGVALEYRIADRPGRAGQQMASITYYATSGVPKEERYVAGAAPSRTL
jgi:hypothetical protein